MADFGIGEIGIALTAASALAGAVGTIASANSQANADNYNSQVEAQNATLATQEAQQKADLIRRRGAAAVGSQTATAAANGLDLSSGSFQDLESNSLQNMESDRLSTLYEGKIGAWNSTARSQLDSMSADSAETAGEIGAGKSILSGAGSTIDKLYPTIRT